MVELRIVRHTDAAAFLDACGPFLLAREAEHCVMLGFALAARDRPAGAPGTGVGARYLAAMAEDGPVLIAMVTPGHAAVLSVARDPDAVDPMARALAADAPDLPGFEGAPGTAAAFALAWRAAGGRAAVVAMRERLYRLDRLRSPEPPAAGRARPMTADDVALVGAWIEAFVAEALPSEPPFDGRATAAGWLADPYRRLRLWVVDDAPVAMALAAWPTATGVRVSYVYTPPGSRGRGYGTAVTAAVTAEEVAAGRTTCFLYADLANASSNAIYRRLGYEPVADVDRYQVEPPGPPPAGASR